MLDRLVSLAAANRVVLITGPNGSGKSTLLEAYSKYLFSMEQQFGILSQHDALMTDLTCGEIIDLAKRPEANDYLEIFNAVHIIHRNFGDCSSGEKSKLLISLALCFEVTLLDEPLAHLDQSSKRILENLVAESEHSFVIANHERGYFRFGAKLELSSGF